MATQTVKQMGAAAFNTGKEVANEKVAEIRKVAAQQLQEKTEQLKEKAGELATQAKERATSWLSKRVPFLKN